MAFRVTRALRMVVSKTSTGLVGLPVDVNGRANLIALQKKILESVKKIPEHVEYRKDVEAISNYRLKVAEENADAMVAIEGDMAAIPYPLDLDDRAIQAMNEMLIRDVEQEETIEQEINRGQLEELIEQGDYELKLIDKYYEWRLWEAVEKMNTGRKELEEESAQSSVEGDSPK